MGNRRNRLRAALLMAALLAGAPAPAEAGILDGIMDAIGGLFGGGKKKGAVSEKDRAEFTEALDLIERSQQEVHALEAEIIERHNQAGADSEPDPELLARLEDAFARNRDLYGQLLDGLEEAGKAGVDLSAFDERVGAIRANQRQIEEAHHEIIQAERRGDLFSPPGSASPAAKGAVASAPPPATPTTFSEFLEDPRVRRAIDEWLAHEGLDEWGRLVGNVAGGRITANGKPETDGRARHRYVWDHFWAKAGRGGGTLRQYVLDRLGGGPSLPPGSPPAVPPATGPGSAPPAVHAVHHALPEAPLGIAPGPAAPGASLASVDAAHGAQVRRVEEAVADPDADPAEALAELERLRELQAARTDRIAAAAE